MCLGKSLLELMAQNECVERHVIFAGILESAIPSIGVCLSQYVSKSANQLCLQQDIRTIILKVDLITCEHIIIFN